MPRTLAMTRVRPHRRAAAERPCAGMDRFPPCCATTPRRRSLERLVGGLPDIWHFQPTRQIPRTGGSRDLLVLSSADSSPDRPCTPFGNGLLAGGSPPRRTPLRDSARLAQVAPDRRRSRADHRRPPLSSVSHYVFDDVTGVVVTTDNPGSTATSGTSDSAAALAIGRAELKRTEPTAVAVDRSTL